MLPNHIYFWPDLTFRIILAKKLDKRKKKKIQMLEMLNLFMEIGKCGDIILKFEKNTVL